MRLQRTILMWICLLASTCLVAGGETRATQNNPFSYSVRLWQTDEGLPQNEVLSITQSRSGFLWVGTREGLARFDGITFTLVPLKEGLIQPKINCLRETPDGILWIGTDRDGVFGLKDGRLTHLTSTNGLPDDHIMALEVDSSGVLWIGSDGGLTQCRNGQAARIFETDLNSPVRSLACDANGKMFVGMNTNVVLVASNQVMAVPALAQIEFHGPAYSLLTKPNGDLLIAIAYGLLEIKGEKPRLFLDDKRATSVASRVFYALLEDYRGNVWAGSRSGLHQLLGDRFTEMSEKPLDTASIYCIYQDQEKNIWVGTEAGLVRLVPRQMEVFGRAQGLKQDEVTSVLCARDSSLWVGTSGGGVNQIKSGRVVFGSVDVTNKLSSEFISTLCESKDGSLWIGTPWAGLNRISTNGQILKTQEAGQHILSLFEDSRDRLWVGTTEGLYIKEGEGPFKLQTNFNKLRVAAMTETPDGCIWLGTDRGLSFYQSNSWSSISTNALPIHAAVTTFFQGEDDSLWVATRGDGLFCLQKGRWSQVTSRQGLASDSIFAMLDGGDGRFWFAGSQGIFSCLKADLLHVARGLRPSLLCNRFGRAEGAFSVTQPNDGCQRAACRDSDAKLWFRSSFGLVLIDPQQIELNPIPPAVFVESLTVNQRSVALDISDKGDIRPVDLSPGNNKLEIKYTGLSYRASEKNRFRYQLKGIDQGWVDAGTRRVAYYDNLQPGNYVFQVVACNNDGVWSPKAAEFAITLQPHFWQTNWFRALCVIMVVTPIIGTVRFLTMRRMERKLQTLERKHAVEVERTRIARDLHDDLGARLTEILMLNERTLNKEENRTGIHAPYLKKINGVVREMAENLDAIVWAADPRHDYLDSLVLYLFKYLDGVAESSEVRVLRDVPVHLPHLPLTSIQKHNLFLIVKEALNNAFKHAGASEIWFRVAVANQTVTMTIEDNGRGFVAANHDEFKNGLQNMRNRMEAIGGELKIVSQPGQGVRVIATLTLPREKKYLMPPC